MTNREKVIELKQEGKSYKEISDILSMPIGTVRSICVRAKNKEKAVYCKYCGKLVKLTKGKREKKFCSDKCRHKWWNDHKDLIKKSVFTENTCLFCGKKFVTYGNRHRNYCCRDHYDRARQGGHSDERVS